MISRKAGWVFLALCGLVSANAQTADFASREVERSSSQATTAAVPNLEEQREIAGTFVKQKLALWQERLKLTDWKISIAMVSRSDLKPKTLGGTRWDKDKKTATVWVLDPAEYKLSFHEILNDLELTVVHELVHLDLASLPRSEASRSNEEHAVNRLAEALLTLDHQK